MAVGKTSVGRLLAASLRWEFSDSDGEIRAQEGTTARELQDARGAAVLHELEARLLLDALARVQPSVVCAAASTIDDERCRAALRGPGVSTIWLQATLATMVARYEADPHRPHYPQGTAAALAAQLATRRANFCSVASATIAVDDLTPEQTAGRVLSLIRSARA